MSNGLITTSGQLNPGSVLVVTDQVEVQRYYNITENRRGLGYFRLYERQNSEGTVLISGWVLEHEIYPPL